MSACYRTGNNKYFNAPPFVKSDSENTLTFVTREGSTHRTKFDLWWYRLGNIPYTKAESIISRLEGDWPNDEFFKLDLTFFTKVLHISHQEQT